MKKSKIMAMLMAMAVATGMMAGCGSSADKVEIVNGRLSDVVLERPEIAADAGKPEILEGAALAENTAEVSKEALGGISGKVSEEVVTETSGAVQAPDDNAESSMEDSGNTSGSSSENGSGKSGNSSGSSGKSGNSSGSSGKSGNSSGSSGGGSGGSANASVAPSVPAHEHVWKAHEASRQEWVSEMVTVDDYETQYVAEWGDVVCNCGARNFDEEHVRAHLLAGEPSNEWVEQIWVEQKVKVGSHQEDHGHYETVSYVDYYYCDCGATK